MILKYLMLIFILVSCALPEKRTSIIKELTYAQKMERCVFQMINKFAIKADTALEVCEGIHKRKK